MEPVYGPVIRFTLATFKLQGVKVSRTGQEHIPRTGGGVVAMNHIGYLDFALAGHPFYDVGRLVRFMAKKEVFDHKISGPLMRGMKHIPVDRSAGAGAYAEAVRALRSGELVGVFPEATISRSFELKEFKSGAVRMAQEAGVPLIPTIIWGSQRIWTKDHKKRLLRPKAPVTITVGEPIHVGPDDDVDAVTQELKRRMEVMLEEAKDSYEPLVGDDLKYLPARRGGTAPTPQEAARLEELEKAEREARKAERRAQS